MSGSDMRPKEGSRVSLTLMRATAAPQRSRVSPGVNQDLARTFFICW